MDRADACRPPGAAREPDSPARRRDHRSPRVLGFGDRAKVDFADKALRALSGEHSDGVRNIIGSEDPGRILGASSGEFRGHAAGADDADADTVLAKILGHAAGEALQSPFGGAIQGAAGKGVFSGEGTDIDNVAAAALNHEGSDGAGNEEGALEICIDDAVPILLGFVLHGAKAGVADAGVVDEQGDGTKMGFRGVDERGNIREIGDIGGLRK